MPRLRLDVEKVAWPEEFRVLVLSVFVPSLNVTLPAGTAVPGALATTVAVKVTDWPCLEGLSDEVTELVVPSLLTVCVKAEEVLGLKLALPLYVAVMEWEATASVEVLRVAWPAPSKVEVPNVEAPSLNVTVPVGTPPLEVTVAVKVTGWLKTEGLAEELTVVVVEEAFCTVCRVLPLLKANKESDA